MSLRDLEPGERFTAEFEVRSILARGVETTSGNTLWYVQEGDTLHNVTKLPPRARPVRKGDPVVLAGRPEKLEFLAISLSGRVYMTIKDVPRSGVKANVTHADGAPIDWEASE